MGRVNPVTFMQEVISELRKSVWPSKEEVARLTAVVIALAIAIGFFLGALDRLFNEVFTRFVF
jgi:preprotein translocase SecE subunit